MYVYYFLKYTNFIDYYNSVDLFKLPGSYHLHGIMYVCKGKELLCGIDLIDHLYGKGSDSSSNLQEEILNVVARSTLGSSAAYTLLRELEEQLPGILPFV